MKRLFLLLFLVVPVLTAIAQTPAPTPPPDPPLEDYVGKYVFPDGSVVPEVEVALADGALSMHSNAGSSSLTKLGVDSFSIVEFNGTAVFKRGEDKKVKSVHIEAAGYILDGEKVPTGGWSFRVYILAGKEMILPGK